MGHGGGGGLGGRGPTYRCASVGSSLAKSQRKKTFLTFDTEWPLHFRETSSIFLHEDENFTQRELSEHWRTRCCTRTRKNNTTDKN